MTTPVELLKLAAELKQQGNLARALALLKKAVVLDPEFARAHYQLGVIFHMQGKVDSAISAFEKAIKSKPEYVEAWSSLGSMLMISGRFEQGVECFQRALAINPDHIYSLVNYGRYLTMGGQYSRAEEILTHAMTVEPMHSITHRGLGLLFYKKRNYHRAEQCLQRSLQIDSRNLESILALAEVSAKNGKHKVAVQYFDNAIEISPNNLVAQIGKALTLPQTYNSSSEVEQQRNSYQRNLNGLIARTDQFVTLSSEEKISAAQKTNFLLAYQGQNDRKLQEEFADFQCALLKSALPEFYRDIDSSRHRSEKLRVGFVSEFFYSSTAGKYFSSWVTDISKEKFETTVFSLAAHEDSLTEKIRVACDNFISHNESLASLAGRIREAKLDILIYPDLGMTALAFALASMRLAPVQCAAWGHPVTTGHKNIDVFFTVESMEPTGSDSHYTERLIRLPGIGTSYDRPSIPETLSRAELGLPQDSILYLFPHSLFKIHPDNDELLLDILSQEPDAVIVMFRSRENAITQQTAERLSSKFSQRGLDPSSRLKILPRASHQEYLQINQACDVMLDSLFWSGGNTSLDAIASALPIVTLPGNFMRGRQSYAMLMEMGLDELIANSREQYIQIALELGRDSQLRGKIKERLRKYSSRIFAQTEPIRALETHLLLMSE